MRARRPFYSRRSNASAFTLVELLVSVTIMTFIVYALFSMFNQTQKAMRDNVTQVDVLESGRAAAELIGRELEEMVASKSPELGVGFDRTLPLRGKTNFFVGHVPMNKDSLILLDVDDQTKLRTNVLQQVFFLTSHADKWTGIGYRVIGGEINGVGTLYRYASANVSSQNMPQRNFYHAYTNEAPTSSNGEVRTNVFNRVADGVVHLRFQTYDPDGYRLGYDTLATNAHYRIFRGDRSRWNSPGVTDATQANVVVRQDFTSQRTLYNSQVTFISNALPAYVEVELGVLEPDVLKKYRALNEGNENAAKAYLSKQSSKVHIFRQRIPIRTVTP